MKPRSAGHLHVRESMKHLYLIALLNFQAPAWAGESIIIGNGQQGLYFEFSFYFGDAVTTEEPESEEGSPLSLSVWKYVPSSRGTVTRKTIRSIDGACYFITESQKEVIRCNSKASNGFANVIYANRKKTGSFRCIKNCTKQIPAVLRWEDVPNGC